MSGSTVKIALAGNPNSGKTTTFNQLVGAREKIGNWHGTTVERKEGQLKYQGQSVKVVDLPGTYSLSAYSIDERIARDFLIKGKPDVVVTIIDASNLERNLYLVIQLLEMGQNVVLALNMMDVVRRHGIEIDIKELSGILNIPVVETVASRGQGLDTLKDAMIQASTKDNPEVRIDYGEREEDVKNLEEFFTRNDVRVGMSPRALAVKVLEGDAAVLKKLEERECHQDVLEKRDKAEKAVDGDLESFMIERRYAYINGLVKECSHHHLTIEERMTQSDRIDKILTNRFLGIPIFLSLMYVLFSLVFKIGQPMVDMIGHVFGFLGERAVGFILSQGGPQWMASLISDGIVAGVGSVLSFLPYILLLS